MYEMGKVSFRYYMCDVKEKYFQPIVNVVIRFVNKIAQEI